MKPEIELEIEVRPAWPDDIERRVVPADVVTFYGAKAAADVGVRDGVGQGDKAAARKEPLGP